MLCLRFQLFLQAKLQASLSWILAKSYKEGIPAEFKEPFYETPEVDIIMIGAFVIVHINVWQLDL